MKNKYTVNHSALNVDRFDERRFNELMGFSEGLLKTVKKGNSFFSDSL